MIECYLAIPPKEYCDEHSILIPHEVNNQFLGSAARYLFPNNQFLWKVARYLFPRHSRFLWKTVRYLSPSNNLIGLGDYGTVVIISKQIDKYLKQLQILESKFDEIVKIIPLPKMIGLEDGHYYPGYLHRTYDGKEVDTVDEPLEFTKEEFFKLLNLIRKKALEAKEKNMNLVFSGD